MPFSALYSIYGVSYSNIILEKKRMPYLETYMFLVFTYGGIYIFFIHRYLAKLAFSWTIHSFYPQPSSLFTLSKFKPCRLFDVFSYILVIYSCSGRHVL